MVMSAYFKATLRMFKKHISRFFSIFAIVLLCISFVSGVGASKDKIKNSIDEYYINQNVSDLIIKSTNHEGFNSNYILTIDGLYNDDSIMAFTTYDVKEADDITRYYYMDLNNITINKIELLSGRMPENELECLVERASEGFKSYNIGDEININGLNYTVSGTVLNPLYFHQNDEISNIDNLPLTNIIYLNNNDMMPITDIYISLNNKDLYNSFSNEYKNEISLRKENYTNNVDNIIVLSLYENISFYSVIGYANKVGNITDILMICFIVVAALVVLSTMSRLVEEERSQIACLATLGYSDLKIIKKYLIFALISTILGGISSIFIASIVANLIYSSFNSHFYMPPMINSYSNIYYILTFVLLLAAILFVTFYVGKKTLKEKPASMLLPKVPKIGKKVILEKIPFIWNKLSFKYKSSLRNLLRYKKHFIMTVVSIIGSTTLVFLGLGVVDYSLHDAQIGTTLLILAIVVVIFAGLLTALVVYTLTNINISERNREIATLMVLGYHDKEICGYIYREVYIMSILGIILGVPFGGLMLHIVFEFLGFGKLSETSIFVWILTPIIVIIFTFIVTIILKKKIVKIDMNESLKARE